MYAYTPATDLHANDEAYLLTVDLPGVSEADIDLTVEGRVLTLRAGGGEDSATRWYRRFNLPRAIAVEDISAQHAAGVLQLRIPRTTPPTRRIPIAHAP